MTREGATIAAVATARGRSALAIVRLSGPDTMAIAGRVLTPWPLVPRQATLCEVHRPAANGDADAGVAGPRELIERGVATLYRAPRSFTGEDVLEITTHGGHVTPLAVLRALIEAGAREAAPGEFTRRAVLSGKLDLVQAEAIGDLIDARTDAMRRVAIRQADGALSARLLSLRDRVLEVEALLAYEIDFPEEDDGPLDQRRVREATDALAADLDALLATSPVATIAREGALVVLAGAPNAGKSSLFNAMLGEARAIVTDVPGTTRDAIEELVEHEGWPLRLVDTAGLRDVDDVVERLGVERSTRYIAGAEVVLACADSPKDVEELSAGLRATTPASVIPVVTKRDRPAADEGDDPALVVTSAHTGRGLHALLSRVVSELGARHGHSVLDAPLLTRARHVDALRTARQEVSRFETAWRDEQIPASVAAVHLRAAVEALDELIGGVDVEEVLGRLFSTFCVGK